MCSNDQTCPVLPHRSGVVEVLADSSGSPAAPGGHFSTWVLAALGNAAESRITAVQPLLFKEYPANGPRKGIKTFFVQNCINKPKFRENGRF